MFKSLLVGTDGSLTAQKAVQQATDLASQLSASIDLVCAFEPVSEPRLRESRVDVPNDLEWTINPRQEVNAILESATAQIQAKGVEVTSFAREGEAAAVILDLAEERGSDLIIVGNKGMAGARRFLLGSVPNKISHHAPCSVLIAHTT